MCGCAFVLVSAGLGPCGGRWFGAVAHVVLTVCRAWDFLLRGVSSFRKGIMPSHAVSPARGLVV